jgi:multidrug efflux pump subunit AcrA (membrane-fusion protein)
MEVHYKEGQMVHKGESFIDIDPRPSEATLKQAEGSLQHDQGLLAQARMDLQRYKDAFAKNAIAKQQLDDQEQIVVQYEGTVKADEGTVAYDRVQLEYCHIVSPINGRVGLRLVDPGNTVFAGSSSTLIVITQLQPITVVFNVSEDDLPRVQEQLNGEQQAGGGCLRPRQRASPRGRHPDLARQPGRHHDRHRALPGGISQQGHEPVSQPVRQCTTARTDAQRRHVGADPLHSAQRHQPTSSTW